jgi:hypothetical protein
MKPEGWNSSLLGNDSVNWFLRKRTRATIEEQCFLCSPRNDRCYETVTINTPPQQ